jgi:hypothetical protein
VLIKKPSKTTPTRSFTGGDVSAAGDLTYKLVPACRGIIPWQEGTGLHLLAKE